MIQPSSTRLHYLDELTRIDGYLSEIRGARTTPSSGDPEVRRILEAAAFLAAQNQRIAYQATFDALRALVEQRLDFVVRPLPARGLLAATHAGARAPLGLRQGTAVHLTTRDGRVTRLATEVSAIVAPTHVRRAEWVESARGPVLLFEVELEQSLRELGWLSLYVDVLGDWARSLALHQQLARGSRGAFLFPRGTSGSRRLELDFDGARPLEFSCGRRESVEADFDPRAFAVDRALSPLEEIRAHLQLPERSLFLNFRPPGRADPEEDAAGYGTVRLGLLLGPGAPTSAVSASCFRPNVLPVQNLVHAPAQPIQDEGYASRYPLRPPEELLWQRERAAGGPFELQGVSRVVASEGKEETRLLPTSLGDAARSYRLTRSALVADDQRYLELAVPGTASAPRRVRVEAAWCQPGLDLTALGQVTARLFHLATEGVSWKLLPRSAPFVPSPVEGSAEKLVELLALSNRKRLERDEIVRVLGLLAQGTEGPWTRLIEALGAMQFEDVLRQDGKAALRRRILVEVRPLPEELLAPLEDLLDLTARLSSAWGHEEVEVLPHATARARRAAGGGP